MDVNIAFLAEYLTQQGDAVLPGALLSSTLERFLIAVCAGVALLFYTGYYTENMYNFEANRVSK